MTATTAEALEAALPKLTSTGTVFHAWHEDNDLLDINELFADLDTAIRRTGAIYANDEYGHALIPAGAIVWRRDGSRWELIDQRAATGIYVQQRHVFGSEAGVTAEPTVSFRELLAANPGTVTDDTEILITAGELRERLDELGRLRAQADEDAAVACWCLHSDEDRAVRTAVLSNHFGPRGQAVLDARLAALGDDRPRDRVAQLAVLRGTDTNAAVPAEVWYYSDDDEASSPDVYADADTAKNAAIARYVAEYEPADVMDETFTWRESTLRSAAGTRQVLHLDNAFTGWFVDSVRVIAPEGAAPALVEQGA